MPAILPLLSRLLLCLALFTPVGVHAQTSLFAPGWVLQPQASTLNFQSVKNGSKVETSGFATFSGAITAQGAAKIRVALDSVDTRIDLRNVRMRFLFFETFSFPEATIAVQLDPVLFADLATRRRLTMPLTFTLTLHGVTQERTADVTVTLISDDVVAIASAAPISIPVADFNLAEGITKLEETAKVKIVPSASVTFDFLFQRSAGAAASQPQAEPEPAAVEVAGDFNPEACAGRFEILSRAGNITFGTASARLDASSNALLDSLLDIISRCPGMRIEVGGHTDTDGSDATNLVLSEKRAGAVADYLTAKGIGSDRLAVKGYGEVMPLLPDTSADNKRRNRRISFAVLP